MAKAPQIPGLKTGSSLITKVVLGAILVALAVIVVKYPEEAAGGAKALISGIGAVIDGLVSFFRAAGR